MGADLFQAVAGCLSVKRMRTIDLQLLNPYFHGSTMRTGAPSWLGSAKYVEFTTLNDPAQMPGVRRGVLDWPYTEGLRLDEANHPLALLTFGLYGEALPNQDGAPVRIVIAVEVRIQELPSPSCSIRFTDKQPATAWNKSAPNEYGFYSNVNPHVDHPRWSQAKERRIGEFLKRPTLMFNGYDQVASLYTGMDLKKILLRTGKLGKLSFRAQRGICFCLVLSTRYSVLTTRN